MLKPGPPFLLSSFAVFWAQAGPGLATLRDVAGERGLTTPNVCGSLEKDYILEVNGSGAAWLDFDGDGDLDLWVANGSTLEALREGRPGAGNRLYRNDGGSFVDVTEEAGVATSRFGCGVAVGDYDADGDPDVFVAEFGPDRLFRNVGNGKFVECAETAGVADPRWGTSAVFLDADLDGDLDLYVANYLEFDLGNPKGPGGSCQWKGHPVMCGPQGLTPSADAFYRNDDGRFVEASADAGLRVPAPGYGLGVVALDAEGDGDADLYVANDSTPNFLFLNRGDGRFVETGFLAGVALSSQGREQAGMGIAVGDADGEGLEDLFVTNFSGEPNAFYRNVGGGLFSDDAFPAGLGGPSVPLLGWGTAFADLDLDGDLDLLTANGHVYPQADLPGTDSAYAQPMQVYENDGRGRFREVSASCGTDPSAPAHRRAVALGDFDEDRDLDAFVSVLGGPPHLLLAEPRGANSLAVRLQGTRSNRDGYGAKVTLSAGGRKQVRFARAGYSFQSSNDPRVHFGLGSSTQADSIEVLWPSGAVDRIEGMPAGGRLVAIEGRGMRADPRRGRPEKREGRSGPVKGAFLLPSLAGGALRLQSESRPASAPATRPVPAIEALLGRARELGRREDFPGAEATLKEAFLLAPENPEVHRMLGALYLRAHRFRDSARAFERFLALEPSEVARCPWIGHAYHQLGDLEKAESWYRRVLEADPGNLEAKRGLALTLHKKGEGAAAEALFREVASRAGPGSEALADARRYLGEILLGRGDAQAAILELEKAKAEDPFGPEVAYLHARAYARAGDPARAEEERARHKSLNEHRQEVEALRERLRANPGDVEATSKIAVRLSAMGDHAGAERTLKLAIERAPHDPSPRLSLVDFLEARGRIEEARRALDEAAALIPEAPSIFERAYRFHRARGNFAAMYEAAEAYHKLTGRAPR